MVVAWSSCWSRLYALLASGRRRGASATAEGARPPGGGTTGMPPLRVVALAAETGERGETGEGEEDAGGIQL